MGNRLKAFTISVLFAVAAAAYMGCATMIMTEAAPDNKGYTSKKRVLTDTIVALGKPDAALAKALEKDDCVAFIGEAHTYMLHEGGQALWEISQLKLDGNRMTSDGAKSKAMFMQGNQVWGKLILTYDGGKTMSPEQREELRKGGFVADSKAGGNQYRRAIEIKGTVLSAVNSSTLQMPKLKKGHAIKFYASKHHASNPLVTVVQVPFVVVGVAIDVALLPVYTLALVAAASQ